MDSQVRNNNSQREREQLQIAKKNLRKKMIAIRDGIHRDVREQKDKRIAETLLQQEAFLQTDTVFLFASFGSEVATMHIIEEAIKLGKTVGLPRVTGKTMDFFAIDSKEDLKDGRWGIKEPKETCPLQSSTQLIVMPGVAFDEEKNRLGYGGGYYDRYLERYQQQDFVFPLLIAIAYEEQIIGKVPTVSTDVTPNMIITDVRIL